VLQVVPAVVVLFDSEVVVQELQDKVMMEVLLVQRVRKHLVVAVELVLLVVMDTQRYP
jgi:hypothetical protein